MQKLLFVDVDDVLFESTKMFNYYLDQKVPKYGTREILKHQYLIDMARSQMDIIIDEARKSFKAKEKPSFITHLGGLDVYKQDNCQGESFASYLRRTYYEPCKYAKEAYQLAIDVKEHFLEERDTFLENDNRLIRDRQFAQFYPKPVIEYDKIYCRDNILSSASDDLEEIFHMHYFEEIFALSHVNGDREYIAKDRGINNYFSFMQFIGLSFHSSSHIPNIRRMRSSKAEHIKKLFNLKDLSNCVLIDDSENNLSEWTRLGGIAILFKPLALDEISARVSKIYNYPRITRLNEQEIMPIVKNKVLLK